MPEDLCPYNIDGTCKLTQKRVQEDNAAFFDSVCTKSNYVLNCPNFTRKDYVSKTYRFIEPARCCPYLVDGECEIRGVKVREKNSSFYKSTCCNSSHYHKCSYFVDRIDKIKENRHFKAAYRCPYLAQGVCHLRKIYVYDKNRTYYQYVCSKTDYRKSCTHFLDKIGKLKCPIDVEIADRCPYSEGSRCTLRRMDMRDKCRELYDYCCCKPNYYRCCPYYVETLCDD